MFLFCSTRISVVSQTKTQCNGHDSPTRRNALAAGTVMVRKPGADYLPIVMSYSRFSVTLYFTPSYSILPNTLETKLSVLPSPFGFVSL